MKRDDPFENRLQRQPLRPLPPAWRAEILAHAHDAEPRPSLFTARPASGWREWLWPCPQAWAALAATWLIILTLDLVGHEPPPARAQNSLPPSPEMRELLRQQEQLRAELIGPVEQPTAARFQPAFPRPRSERREDAPNA